MNEKPKRSVPLWGVALITVFLLVFGIFYMTWVVNSAYERAADSILQQKEAVFDGKEPCPYCGRMYEEVEK